MMSSAPTKSSYKLEDSLSDEWLKVELCSGEEIKIRDAIAGIYQRYAGYFFRVVRRSHMIEEDIRDVIGEVLAELLSDAQAGRLKIAPSTTLRTFLYNRARSRAIDLVRKQISSKKRDEKYAEAYFHPDTLENSATIAQSSELSRELKQIIQQAFDTLSDRDRLIIECSYELLEKTTALEAFPKRQEIAKIVSVRYKKPVSVCNVRDAVNTFRGRLAKLLQKANATLPLAAKKYL